ncbi:hypothetical protein BU24DRAFT_407697 [Aaosphaeria arxii CBS 175.79]|uniref:Zinc-ribbon 15 domain-containing protein n=1 Tax=Aaosphaeria arxii CBS 175.79 TaxID=1450172 RepID=A0A6A5XXN0_9PLEO|nr:uncharacterized protein BU24DRAFT_407697 [Aaosphaeria arxii CBS 175.79]KAF2017706.1 hypothetical protein BU24DRAFT_407697 [Aaosphaeria arxii CBS 175.79]
MFFFFTCGTHTFSSRLSGHENLTVQCQNCGNFSGHLYKRWEWFTFCFIPIVPFSLKPYRDVGCHICNFYQDIKYRPDVQAQMGGGGQQQQGYAMGPPQGQQGQQGYGGHYQGQGGPPPHGGVPQYK